MTITQALNAYRDAVARRAFWEENGSRRDGQLTRALSDERQARRDLMRAIHGVVS